MQQPRVEHVNVMGVDLVIAARTEISCLILNILTQVQCAVHTSAYQRHL